MAEDRTDKSKDELKETLAEADKSVAGTKAELEQRVDDMAKEHRPDVYVARIPRK